MTPRFQFNPIKIVLHHDRLAEWLERGDTLPITAELDITNRCNFKCPWCSSREEQLRSSAQMSGEEVKFVLSQLNRADIKAVTFTGGGEPSLNPHLGESLFYARHFLDLDVALITNGSNLNRAAIRLALDSCTWIRVSVDEIEPEEFKRIKGVSRLLLQRIAENIATMAALKKHTTLGVQFLVHPDNEDRLDQFADWARMLGVDYCQFTPVVMHQGQQYEAAFWSRVLKKLLHLARTKTTPGFKVIPVWHKFADLAQPESNYGRTYEKCYGHCFTTVIGADLTVWLCCHMRGHKEMALGNLKQASFVDIWSSSRRQAAVQRIKLDTCQPCCRNHEINKILWSLRHEIKHKNFL